MRADWRVHGRAPILTVRLWVAYAATQRDVTSVRLCIQRSVAMTAAIPCFAADAASAVSFRGQEGPSGGPFEGKLLSSQVGFQSLDRVEVGDDRLG
jgi:hypothetical protein